VAATLSTRVAVRSDGHRARVYRLRTIHRHLRTGTSHTFTLRLPGVAVNALVAGAKESVRFALTAKNANGTGKATTTIKNLHPSV
jgi:hypothetical protein